SHLCEHKKNKQNATLRGASRQGRDGEDAVMTDHILPLTPDRWPDFEDLFGKQGACYGCWCTYFRMAPKERKASSSEERKQFIRTRIENGPPPGLLAYDEGRAVGWMQIGPRRRAMEQCRAQFGADEEGGRHRSGGLGDLLLLSAARRPGQGADPCPCRS